METEEAASRTHKPWSSSLAALRNFWKQFGKWVLQRWSRFGVQHRVFLAFQFAIAIWAVYMLRHFPPPGRAVAIMAAAAALMSIHAEMRRWQKALWMLLICALLFVELHAISEDRRDGEKRALDDRHYQDQEFAKVLAQQNSTFQATADRLNVAISGIQSALRAASITESQTRPHANFQIGSFEVMNRVDPGVGFIPNVTYDFNINFTNTGNEAGTMEQRLFKFYLGKPDDKRSEAELIKKFNQAWEIQSRQPLGKGTNTQPGEPSFWSDKLTLSDTDGEAIRNGDTLYLFARIQYSDETGVWGVDKCESLQKTGSQMDILVGRDCSLFTRTRYQIK